MRPLRIRPRWKRILLAPWTFRLFYRNFGPMPTWRHRVIEACRATWSTIAFSEQNESIAPKDQSS